MTTTARPNWRCPDARQVLRADAPRDLWLAERRRGLGGSDASTVLQLNPYSSHYTLWLDKTGRAKPKPESPAMRRGKLMEPLLGQMFLEETGIPTRQIGLLRHRERPWMQVSVDGLSADGGIIEKKTTHWRTNDAEVWRAGDIPDHAEAQAQWGLAVTGRSHAHVMVLIDIDNFIVKVVERHEALIAEMINQAEAFWRTHVEADIAPPVDDSDATLDAVIARYEQAEEDKIAVAGPEALDLWGKLAAARAQAAAGEKDVKKYLGQLAALFGDGEVMEVMGEVTGTWRQNGNFVTTRFLENYPDLAPYYIDYSLHVDTERLRADHPNVYRACRARVMRVGAPKKTKSSATTGRKSKTAA
jgi:putative phage-type endonuclease